MLIISSFKKVVSIVTLSCFLVSIPGTNAYSYIANPEVSFNNKTFLQDTFISNAYGRITEKAFFDNPEIIINISDLHCNPGVQRKIVALIEEINDKYGIDGIYVEGGYDNVNTGWISKIEDKNVKRGLLDVLLNSGRLTGAEYYSMLNNKYDILKGIENRDVHKQNIIRLNEILSRQEYYKKN